jgi:hypothetical protein
MKAITIVAAVLLTSALCGCATSREVYTADGSLVYAIECFAQTPASCTEKAGEICGTLGYRFVKPDGSPLSLPAPATAAAPVVAPTTAPTKLLVESDAAATTVSFPAATPAATSVSALAPTPAPVAAPAAAVPESAMAFISTPAIHSTRDIAPSPILTDNPASASTAASAAPKPATPADENGNIMTDLKAIKADRRMFIQCQV